MRMTSSWASSIATRPSGSWRSFVRGSLKFGLALHPDKTRLIEFGPFADRNRRGRGQGKPETFNFLGFTHICGKKRSGRFTVLRQTMRQRLQAKLQAVKAELRRRMHSPIPEQGAYLRSVVGGAHPVLRGAHERSGASTSSAEQWAGCGVGCFCAAARPTVFRGTG